MFLINCLAEIKCHSLLNISDGYVVVKGILVGDMAVYECLDQYKLEGDRERVCQSSGQWNGTQPSCLSK